MSLFSALHFSLQSFLNMTLKVLNAAEGESFLSFRAIFKDWIDVADICFVKNWTELFFQ